jgi:hypothetical protein
MKDNHEDQACENSLFSESSFGCDLDVDEKKKQKSEDHLVQKEFIDIARSVNIETWLDHKIEQVISNLYQHNTITIPATKTATI